MKKLLSIVLVLLMAMSVFACTNTPAQPEKPAETEATQEPAQQPTEQPEVPADTPVYEGLALNIKNKTGKTIDALYICPVGGDLGNSVVESGWKDKDVDGENYEKNIYIVREKGAALEAVVMFDDQTSITVTADQLGTLSMYDKLSFKGPTAEDLKHEANDDPADIEAMNLVAAIGKTADNFYPGYELIPVEFKNKTGKGIKELYFYEQGAADPKAYNNMIDYLYTDDGVKMDALMSGKAKEGGMYLFKCFIRPHAENYMIDVVFDDGTSITYPIEDWFKADGSGHLPNEISLKSAEDPDDIKVQYDDGDPEPLQYLAESLEKGYAVDQWYPTYATVEADAAAVEAAKAELAKIPVPAPETPAEEPAAEVTEPEQPAAQEGFVIPEGYTGLVLNVKNKTGKTITELLIYAKTDSELVDTGRPIFDDPWLDKDADGDNYERNIYIIRETADSYMINVVFEDGTEFTSELGALAPYDKISLKGPTADDINHEPNDDPADIAAMDALVAAGVPTDGLYPVVLADVPAGYTALHLMLKNKSGKEIEKVYLFPTGEDKGKNIFKLVVEGMIPTEDESVEGKPHEVFAYVFRETAKLEAMTLRIKYADGTEQDIVLENPVEDYTVFTLKADEFRQKVADDPEDIAAMDNLMLQVGGASTDGVEFEPIA